MKVRRTVWDLPTRIFHWLLAVLILFSWWSVKNHHTDWHIWSGIAILTALIFRILWGLFGSSTARFANFVRGRASVRAYLRGEWTGTGHTPLGALSVVALLAAVSVQVGLGLVAQDPDGIYAGPLAGLSPVPPPFTLNIQRRYNPEGATEYNIVPGLVATILTLTLVMMTALAMTREVERGTMETLLSTPVRPIEVMIGKLTPYVMVGVIQASIIITMARLLFGVPMAGGWPALLLGLLLFIIGSLSLGFLVSTLARNQLQAMQMTFFYFLPSILLSGFLFPFRGMPQWAQWIGTAVPVTHMLRVIRGSMLKGVGIAEASPSLGALALFVLIVASIAVKQYRTTLD